MSRHRACAGQIAKGLTLLYAVDRLVKAAALAAFLRRATPAPPTSWPPVTMLHPITQMDNTDQLAANLTACANLDYPAPRQHLLLCDAADRASQACCRHLLATLPHFNAQIVCVPATAGPVAPKIVKLMAGLAIVAPTSPDAILCLIDDDIAPRPTALRDLVAALAAPTSPISATFGLPCYTNWRTPWSALLSGLNNANFPAASALLTWLSPPPRITGHLVAYRWHHFQQAGGLAGLEDQIDDDFAFARRLLAIGRQIVQTPVCYDVDNDLASGATLARQLRRWFVLPRQAMAGALAPREAISGIVISLGVLVPPSVALLAILIRSRTTALALLATLGLYSGSALINEGLLRNPSPPPPHRWWTFPLTALLLPAYALAAALFANDEVEWRGQRLRIARGGRFERLP